MQRAQDREARAKSRLVHTTTALYRDFGNGGQYLARACPGVLSASQIANRALGAEKGKRARCGTGFGTTPTEAMKRAQMAMLKKVK